MITDFVKNSVEMKRKPALLLLWILWSHPVWGEAALPPLLKPELESLRAGEVFVTTESLAGEHQGNIWASIWLPNEARSIWEVMVSCEEALYFVPGLEECEVLETGEDLDTRRHKVDYSVIFPDAEYIFRTWYEPYHSMRFSRISGDLKAMEGRWLLVPDAASKGTFIVYSVYLDPGFFVPQWLVRRVLKKNLPEVLISLRNHMQTKVPTT